jgi:hypothetical protein
MLALALMMGSFEVSAVVVCCPCLPCHGHFVVVRGTCLAAPVLWGLGAFGCCSSVPLWRTATSSSGGSNCRPCAAPFGMLLVLCCIFSAALHTQLLFSLLREVLDLLRVVDWRVCMAHVLPVGVLLL